jgi:hypothetical protein
MYGDSMKYAVFTILLLTALFLVSCTEDGDLCIYNKTGHILYATVDGGTYTLSAGSKIVLSVPVKKTWSPFDTEDKKVTLHLEGETFLLVDSNGEEIPEVTVKVEGGKTRSVYVWPDFACVKVVNQSNKRIVQIKAISTSTTHQTDTETWNVSLGTGDEFYKQIEYGTDDDPLIYDFGVYYEDGTEAWYEDVPMELDDLYLIH